MANPTTFAAPGDLGFGASPADFIAVADGCGADDALASDDCLFLADAPTDFSLTGADDALALAPTVENSASATPTFVSSQAVATPMVQATSTVSIPLEGVNYVADIYGSFQNADNLASLGAQNIDAVAITPDFGINAVNDTVYDNDVEGGYTESDEAISSAIKQAAGLGLSVLYRPLIDFLAGDDGTYNKGEWRGNFNPGAAGSASANAFFASYQTMIVAQARLAQAAGASIFSIGAELDGITGPAYETYWDKIITAVRAVFSGKLTYGAAWDDNESPWQWSGSGLAAGTGNIETQVSFWSKLDYIGIDEYAPISKLATPTVAQLIDGWIDAPTDDYVSELTGGKSLMSYYEGLSADLGKPLLFTEYGYANSSDADSNPAVPGDHINGTPDGATADPTLQANLYTAFVDAWTEYGNGSLAGAYAWEWEPAGAEAGNIWDIEGLPAETALATGYGASTTVAFGATPAKLTINASLPNDSTYADVIGGFVARDALDLQSLSYAAGATAVVTNGRLTVTSDGIKVFFNLSGSKASQYVTVGDGTAFGGTDVLGLGAAPIETVAQFLAKRAALDALSTGFYIQDSAADIASEVNTLNGDRHIDAIVLTDAGAPTFTLSAAQVAADTVVLGEIVNPSYSILVKDTAADVSTHFAALAANADVTSIFLTGAGTPTLNLSVAQALNDKTTLEKINENPSWGIAITDTAAHVAAGLNGLNADDHIASIDLSGSGAPVLKITAAQDADDAVALGEIVNALYGVEVGSPVTYYVRRNGASGTALALTASNVTVSMPSLSHLSLTGSNDVITQGEKSNLVVTGAGDQDTLQDAYASVTFGGNGETGKVDSASGSSDTIKVGANSNLSLSGAYDNVTVAAGSKLAIEGEDDNVTAAAGDVVNIGAGVAGQTIKVTGSHDTLSVATGSTLSLWGSSDTVAVAASASVTLNSGASDVFTGSGFSVTTEATGLSLTVGGNGQTGAFDGVYGSSVSLTVSANSNVSLMGTGARAVMRSGSTLQLYDDDVSVTSGANDTIEIDGGQGDTIAAGTSDKIGGLLINSTIDVAGDIGALTIDNFYAIDEDVVDLLNGVGGYTSAAKAAAALVSDGAGGSKLSLGADGSIDFIGVPAGSLSAANLKIG